MKVQFPRALAFLAQPTRYKVLWGGRGGTKSWGIARQLLLDGAAKPLRMLCARETMKSIADSVHKLLGDQIIELGLQKCYTVQQTAIIGKNGTEFAFAGLKHNIDNIKSLEGCDRVWVEEAANVSKASWDKLIPTMRKEGSEIWVSFNPELDTDDTYRRFVLTPPPGAKVVKVGWQDNPWFPEVLRIEKDHLKATDEAAYRHIWEGETRSAVDGAIYAAEIAMATKEGRITAVAYDRTRPVDTFWDLGYEDKTAIWFGQAVNGWYHFIDYFEDSGRTIADYLIELQKKAYLYGTDWLPHDGIDTMLHHKLSGDRSRSIEMIMRAAGRNVRLTPKMYVLDGINAARTIFPQCRFDVDKCYEGLRALRMYQWGPPSASGKLRREPLHDMASHGADGFRGAAISFKQPKRAPDPPKHQIVAPPRISGPYVPFG